MRLLIVNADDFGQTIGITDGIIDAHTHGIVTSTTIMVNGQAFDYALAIAKAHPSLGIGVHLNLVEGQPVSNPDAVSTLVDARGRLLPKYALLRRYLTGRLDLTELRCEVDAQICSVLAAGITPTHVDSHKNIHAFPPFFSVVAETARERGIRAIRLPLERPCIIDALRSVSGTIRCVLLAAAATFSLPALRQRALATTDYFAGALMTGSITRQWLEHWMSKIPSGSTELMVHPGYIDDDLVRSGTRLLAERETELKALRDPSVRYAVDQAGVVLATFGDLTQEMPTLNNSTRRSERGLVSI